VFGYVLGVTATFMVFALILISLREAGQSAGWGFQFQSPHFVVSMAILLFVMALNLFGIFEWILPVFMTSGGKSKSAVIESFLAGVLATIVATPCTAPFMGTALSFSLTQGPMVNLLIFIFIGLGMAFPFVLLCAFPTLLQKLPKPGAWMEDFKKLMGFPLLATVLWLLWVLAGQRDSSAVIMLLGGLLLITFGFWLRKVGKSLVWHMLGWFAILLGIIFPLDHLRVAPVSAPLQIENQDLEWLTYNPTSIQQRLEEGKIVFIDFTARWCLTCQVNKRIALENAEVVKLFADRGVVRYEADWTNQDPGISAALAEFGKNSVPVYVFLYLPEQGGQRQQKILPELLTPAIVKEALNTIQ
jgi:thiol:disulfide interchange protein DsbD